MSFECPPLYVNSSYQHGTPGAEYKVKRSLHFNSVPLGCLFLETLKETGLGTPSDTTDRIHKHKEQNIGGFSRAILM